MGKLRAALELTRIEHSMMLIVAVIAAELLLGGIPKPYIFILSLITPVFISMGAFAINDYFDIDTDRKNKKSRPLVRGDLSPSEALYITGVSMIVGIIGSALINAQCLIIALIFAALSLLYSYKLKDMPLIGNMYIAFSMSIPFIFGNYVLSANLSSAIAVIFVMVFFSGLAREIDGTIRDYEGDTKIRKATTLPKLIGNFASARIAFVLYAAAVIISIYLFYDVTPFSHNLVYALLIAIADISLLYSGAAFVLGKKRSYDFVRNVSLAGMGLALVCVLISSLVYIQTPF